MLHEMKDSGLQSRDRASLVRLGAGIGRTDSSDSLMSSNSFGSETGSNNMLDALDKLDDILSRTPSGAKNETAILEEDDNDAMVSHPDEEDAEEAVTQQDGADQASDATGKSKAAKALTFNVYFDFSDFRFQDWASSRVRPYSIGTLRKKQLSTLELITFTKSPIPHSMLRLPENLSRESVEIFGAIMRFMGDSGKKPTPKQEVEYTHYIASRAINTEGIRDEVFCCIIRQITKNPKEESAVRGWQLLALVLGCVAPSEGLIKFLCGLLQNTVKIGGFAEKWAQLCLKRLQRVFVNGPRTAPPSSAEINSIKNSRPIIIRIQLMDRKAKALDFDTITNSKEIIATLAQKLELREKSGFAIYEKVDPTTERWISPNELLGDMLYKWEAQGWSAETAEAKLLFKKRIFINAHNEPSDPVCKDLLFYQALDDVLCDRFPVTEVEVMRLASLEMQIVWGDHDPSKVHIGRQLMAELDRYLPQPMIPLYSPPDWKTRISEMHATLKGRSSEEAKALYMQHVMKWPLYGSTLFTAKSAVANAYGTHTDLCIAINQEGVYVLARSTKQILDTIDYPNITVMAHTSNSFDITSRVAEDNKATNNVRRHKFTTKLGLEIEKLCRAYSAVYRKLGKQKKKSKEDSQDENQPQGPEHEIVLPPPLDADRFTFTAYAEEHLQNKQSEFTKEPIKNGLHKFDNVAHDKAAVDIFVLIMKYMEDYPARLITQPQKKKPTQAELAQQIIGKAIKQPKLRNEVYCQLMKQTTNNPTLENEIFGWQLLAICAGTFLPSKELMNYVRVYFQEGCKNKVSMEASLLSTLALRKLQRTILNGARTLPPSSAEMAHITKRRTLITKVHTLDGQSFGIPTDGSTTIKELFTAITRKLEVKEVNLFNLYNVVDHDQDREVSMKEAEILGDVMAVWEDQEKQGSASFQIVLKRRDFFNATMQDLIHTVDRDLHFFQALHNVVHSRYPVTETDAVYLAGLHINLLYGNFDPSKDVIAQVVSELEKYLPKTLIGQHSPSDWRNKLLESYNKIVTKSPDETKALYMAHIKKWAYYGCTVFSAKQTLSLNLPKELWLGISKDAVHVFQPNKKDPVASFPFTQIANWGPSNASFFIMTGSFMQPQKYVFITKQGNDMSDLLHLYINRLVTHK